MVEGGRWMVDGEDVVLTGNGKRDVIHAYQFGTQQSAIHNRLPSAFNPHSLTEMHCL